MRSAPNDSHGRKRKDENLTKAEFELINRNADKVLMAKQPS